MILPKSLERTAAPQFESLSSVVPPLSALVLTRAG